MSKPTSEMPKEEGWYIMQRGIRDTPRPCRVYRLQGGEMAFSTLNDDGTFNHGCEEGAMYKFQPHARFWSTPVDIPDFSAWDREDRKDAERKTVTRD